MAITAQQLAQLKPIIDQEGGLDSFKESVFQALANDRRDDALTALAPTVTVTVNDWDALGGFLSANKDNSALTPALADIDSAIQLRDAENLGPLFVALYAACLKHFGL